MEENIFNSLYDFVMVILEPFAAVLSDIEYERLVSAFALTIMTIFVSGLVSAVWGCFGALAALRRSKRG